MAGWLQAGEYNGFVRRVLAGVGLRCVCHVKSKATAQLFRQPQMEIPSAVVVAARGICESLPFYPLARVPQRVTGQVAGSQDGVVEESLLASAII